MNMLPLDWGIVVGLLALMIWAAYYTKRYNRGVADFLTANRCAGRYLLCVSQGIAGLGAITIIGNFEMYYKAGFSAVWWQLIWVVVIIVINASGWVLYRYRETQAMTMAQFLEMRYSKKFRIFAGVVAWISGIINFGIFPSVGARFVIYFCGLPDTQVVYAFVLLILISLALFFTFSGGQIAIIVTDFIQGTFCNIVFVVTIVVVVFSIGWSRIFDTLAAAPAQASLLHPFRTSEALDFNILFYVIVAFGMFYAQGIWLGGQGYFASALNAHEARMGNTLVTWRVLTQNLFMMILPICAFTFMHHPDFIDQAQQAQSALNAIGNSQVQVQMTTPVIMKYFLPPGVMGALVAVMLAAFISTHDTYMHSWGSIFVQDVILPLRKKPLSPKNHVRLLRWSIFGVAIFIFCFSMIFKQTEYILMFFQITGAIFLGGAGAAVIGGLYWKRGSTPAAWSAMITGSTLAVSAIIIKQINDYSPFAGNVMSYIASQNGAILGFYASITAILVYIFVSLLGKKVVFDMDKLLHRGKYSVEGPRAADKDEEVSFIRKMIGMGSEFSRGDKILYLSTLAWTGMIVGVFVVGMICNLAFDIETETWIVFWKYYVLVNFILCVATTVWFVFGGLHNLKEMFARLATLQRDDEDDGTV
jgi:SSS family solute:Na+ symporter